MNKIPPTFAHRPLLTGLALAFACWAPAPLWAQAAVAQPPVAAPVASPAPALSLKAVVSQVLSQNRAIRSKRAEQDIVATGIERASAAFQPIASVSALRSVSRLKNTYEEVLVRQNQDTYERQGNDFSLGVSQLIASGAKLEAKTSLQRFLTDTNGQDPLRPEGALDNRSSLGLSIIQPLARDAGAEVTLARVTVARLDTSVAEHASRDTETSVAAEAIIAYHELVLAQHRVQSARDKISMGERLLAQAQALLGQGRLPQADVWEVANALARYQSGLSEALQAERERSNRLRTQLLSSSTDTPGPLQTSDGLPTVATPSPGFDQSLGLALQHRADYLMRKVQVEREGVQLAYSRNQALPRIDLMASYSINGLEYAADRAFIINKMADYPNWSVGLQLSFPLGVNRQAKADITAASLKQEDALLSLKAIEVQIANDIDTSLALRQSVAQRWALWQEIAQREQQQLDSERLKFAAGRSDTREILLREERVVNARLAVQEQQAAFAKADVLLQAAQGTLLDGFR